MQIKCKILIFCCSVFMSIIAVFPGQGSQYVKMGKDFYDNFAVAKQVFEEVNEVLSLNLSEIIFGEDGGPLQQTQNAQPALMAVSIAIAKVLQSERGFDAGKTAFTAGHSLGEYSALCFAGAISLKNTAIALKHRGNAMSAAGSDFAGAMAAIIGAEDEKLANLIQISLQNSPAGSVLVAANDNSPGQVVISGSELAVEFAISNAKAYGVKLASLLPVSGAFHSPLMASATAKMQDVLSDITITAPQTKVIQNVVAEVVGSPLEIKQNLVKQIQSRVKWRQTMLYAQAAGVTRLIEIGAKSVLCGLAKRTTPTIEQISIEKVADIDKV